MSSNLSTSPAPGAHQDRDNASRVAFVVLGSAFVAVGVLGNSFLLGCLAVFDRLHRPHYLFVGSLAAADFIISGYVILVFVLHQTVRGGWSATGPRCQFNGVFFVTAGWSAVLSLFLLTFNRYMYLCKPKRFRQMCGKDINVILMLSIWVAGLIGTFPSLLDPTAGFSLDPMLHICMYKRKESYFISAIGFVLLIVICGIIFCLLYEIHRQARVLELRKQAALSMQAMEQEQEEEESEAARRASGNGGGSDTSLYRLKPTYKRSMFASVPMVTTFRAEDLRFALGLGIINLCRLLLSLPFITVSLADRFGTGSPVLHRAVFFLMMFNSCMNWIILVACDVRLHRCLGFGLQTPESRASTYRFSENAENLSDDTQLNDEGSACAEVRRDTVPAERHGNDEEMGGGAEDDDSDEEVEPRPRRNSLSLMLTTCLESDARGEAGAQSQVADDQAEKREKTARKIFSFWRKNHRPAEERTEEITDEVSEEPSGSLSIIMREINLWLSGTDRCPTTPHADAEKELQQNHVKKAACSSKSSGRLFSQARLQELSAKASWAPPSNESDLHSPLRSPSQRQRSPTHGRVVQREDTQAVGFRSVVDIWTAAQMRSQSGRTSEDEIELQRRKQAERHQQVLDAIKRKISRPVYGQDTSSVTTSQDRLVKAGHETLATTGRDQVTKERWRHLAQQAVKQQTSDDPCQEKKLSLSNGRSPSSSRKFQSRMNR